MLKSELVVDSAHPLRVATSQVVVDGDDVHAFLREGVQRNRGGRRQRLAFTGAHLSDLALMQHDAAHKLHIEMSLAKHCVARPRAHAQRPREANRQGSHRRCIGR